MSIKKKLGLTKPARTKEEIDQEYQMHAMQQSHKRRLAFQLEEEADKHFQSMLDLSKEIPLVPKAEPQPEPEAKS